MAANTYGRQVVIAATNKSGGQLILGDVSVVDTTNNLAFTTSTAGAVSNLIIAVAMETIANNATGRFLISGYASLINVNASVTRGNFGKTHTVAKQATDAGASRVAGTFVQFTTGGTTPDGIVYPSDLGGASLTNPMTTGGDIIYGASAGAPARLANGSSGQVLKSAGGTSAPTWGAAIAHAQIGTTSLGGSFDTTPKAVYKKVTMSSAGFLASISVGIKGQSSTGINLTVAVMSDNSGTPLNVIAAGGSSPTRNNAGVTDEAVGFNSTARFVTLPVGAWLSAADYWLVVIVTAVSGNDGQLAFSSGTGSDRTHSGTNGIYDNSIKASSSGTNDYSIYADILT